MHGSVSTRLNIYSFADQRASSTVNKYSISADRGSMKLLIHFIVVYCQIYETFIWLRNKNRYLNDFDQKAASYTVRLECATL